MGGVRSNVPGAIPTTGEPVPVQQGKGVPKGTAGIDEKKLPTGITALQVEEQLSDSKGARTAEGRETGFERGLAEYEQSQIGGADAPAILTSMSGAQQEALKGIVGEFTAMVNNVDGASSSSQMQGRWSDFIGDIQGGGLPMDVNALVQHVIRQAYMENTLDLKHYAEKVKFFNECKQQIRSYIQEVRDYKLGLETAAREKFGATLPPMDEPKGKLEEYFNFCANYYAQNAHPVESVGDQMEVTYTQAAVAMATLDNIVDEAAMAQGAEAVADNANNVYKEKFGIDLPPEVYDLMLASLEEGCGDPGDMTKIDKALMIFASFVSYSSDCNVGEDGKFGYGKNNSDNAAGAGGWDDHDPYEGATGPNFEDYLHYVGEENAKQYLGDDGWASLSASEKEAATTQTAGNNTAQTNLASGDKETIAEAFGMDVAELQGSSLDSVVASAMESNNATWKNEVLFNAEISQTALLAQIQAEGPLSEEAEKVFASLGGVDGGQVSAAFNNIRVAMSMTPSGDPLTAEVREYLELPNQVPPQGVTKPDEIQNVLDKWDEELQTVGEDAQLANVDMQNMLQKQQQTMQMMSNISKMLHDTAMAVIRKIG